MMHDDEKHFSLDLQGRRAELNGRGEKKCENEISKMKMRVREWKAGDGNLISKFFLVISSRLLSNKAGNYSEPDQDSSVLRLVSDFQRFLANIESSPNPSCLIRSRWH